MFLSVVILLIMLIILPALSGLTVIERKENLLMSLVYGYILQWAAFFILALYAIFTDRKLDFVIRFFIPFSIALSLLGIACAIIRRKSVYLVERTILNRNEIIYLACFLGILLFQLYKTVAYIYVDGDDSYYIAMSQDMYTNGLLYKNNPYLGNIDTTLNYRYVLSPLPVWIAMLARVCKLQVTTVAFVFVPCVFICISYVLYYNISKILFNENKEKKYLFLLLISVFVMFSNVSTSTAETFLLTRARQGKEALANIVIPYLILMISGLIEEWHKEDGNKKIPIAKFVLILAGALCGGLMSVFGNVLVLLMLFLLFLYVIIKEKSVRLAALISFFAIPNICITLLYIVRG